MTTDLLPFDLETALREPERVRFSASPELRGVRVIHLPEARDDDRLIVLWNDGLVNHFRDDGRHCLRLAPKTRKVVARMYRDMDGDMQVTAGERGTNLSVRRFSYWLSAPTEIEIREDA